MGFLQYESMSNPGNSGGPLVNLDHQLIGICSRNSSKENETYWAVLVDRVRMLLPHLLPADALGGFGTGLKVDLLSDEGFIQTVEPDSPAWIAGLRSGDLFNSVDGVPIRQACEWHVRLMDKQAGDNVNIEIRRGELLSVHKLRLSALPTSTSPELNHLTEGLTVRLYKGTCLVITLLSAPEPDYYGITSGFELESIIEGADVHKPFAMQLDGYLKVESKGIYRVSITSDDGSRLFLNHQLVIDYDLSHTMQKLSRIVSLEAGLTPIRLEYSDIGGDRGLKLKLTRYETLEEADVNFDFLRHRKP